MTLIEWDEAMSVGLEELDDQHRQLLSMVNEAYDSIQRYDEAGMEVLLRKMDAYAGSHFAFEEGHMEKTGYPDLEQHRKMHLQFHNDVADFLKNRFHKTNCSQIFIYLSRWLTHHIMNEDRKYAQELPGKESTE